MEGRRIYLDNAATSWPKPESVYLAVDDYQRHCGAACGRGAYGAALAARHLVDQARGYVSKLLGTTDPRRVVWTLNATDALNLALHGWTREGDHVVTTDLEHNSVLRPVRYLEERRSLRVSHVPCDARGLVDMDALRQAVRSDTSLLVVNHASNVTGAVQPLADIAELARSSRVTLLVDAAQSLGQIPWPLDNDLPLLVAGAGHKSLLGPLGVGFLHVSPGLEERLQPLRQGGTGTHSDDERPPSMLPERYEPGNLNVPGIVGLRAGLEEIERLGIERIESHHARLRERLCAGLAEIPGLVAYGPASNSKSVGVVSVTVEGIDPQELASILDSSYGIQTRAGLHCAPRIHEHLGTRSLGGTLRLSLGWATSDEEVDAAAAALAEIVEGMRE